MTRILITGASGQLGSYLLSELRSIESTVVAWTGSRSGKQDGFLLQPVDLADRTAVATAFREARPALIVHAAAMSRIDACHQEPARSHQVNVAGTTALAELAQQVGAKLVYVSTDLVFDGRKGRYREQDLPAPLSVYGRTKLEGEQAVLNLPRSAVVRVSLMFGPTRISRPGFFDQQLDRLRGRQAVRLFVDEWRTPLSLRTAARTLLAVAQSDFEGLLHLGGPERMTRWEMGSRLAEHIGADPSLLVATKQAELAWPEPRPADVSLDSSQFRELFPSLSWPLWDAALEELGI
jgi:dTDP-4-dehydrorhamnose reductase